MRIVRSRMSLSVGWLLTALLLGLSSPALAGDGVIEINQAKALAGGVTSGDTEGFPVTISESGSYRLTGNLTVPDENTNAIDVSADDVTVDLNGFAIVGPTVCTGTPVTSCSPTGTGRGIEFVFPSGNTSVLNGTVRGMGNSGVVIGNGGRVERVRAVSNGLHGILFFAAVHPLGIAVGNWAIGNGDSGIRANFGGIVTDNVATLNGNIGISALNGTVTGNAASSNGSTGIDASLSTVTGNTANSNGSSGIFVKGGTVTGNTAMINADHGIIFGMEAGTVIGNTVADNSGLGLVLGANQGYANNVINGNTMGTVAGGVQMGTNVCDGNTTCP